MCSLSRDQAKGDYRYISILVVIYATWARISQLEENQPIGFFPRVDFPAESRFPVQTPKWMCAWAGCREKTSRGPGGGVGRAVLGCQNTPSVTFIDLSFGPEVSSFAAISSFVTWRGRDNFHVH